MAQVTVATAVNKYCELVCQLPYVELVSIERDTDAPEEQAIRVTTVMSDPNDDHADVIYAAEEAVLEEYPDIPISFMLTDAVRNPNQLFTDQVPAGITVIYRAPAK